MKASNVFHDIVCNVTYGPYEINVDMQPMFCCLLKSETQMFRSMSREFGSHGTAPKQHAEKKSP